MSLPSVSFGEYKEQEPHNHINNSSTMLLYLFLAFFASLRGISPQAIPYSYDSGRNVSAVEDRYNRFQAAKERKAGPEELIEICGKVDLTEQQCTTKFGRPKDSENLGCDSLCCMSGQKVGNCGNDYGFKLNYDKLINSLATGGLIGAFAGTLNESVIANCFCSNEPEDIKCGKDGSFMGLRCIGKNTSACWRKCCREGKSTATCEGVLNSICTCS